MRRTFALLAAVIGMIGALATAPGAAAASSDVVREYDHWMVSVAYPGSCLDDSSGYGLRAHTCSTASYQNGYQRWTATHYPGGVRLRNVATGRCLDGSSGHGLRTHTCSSEAYNNGYQRWHGFGDPGVYQWWNDAVSDKCIDLSANYGLRLHTCSPAAFDAGYQAWRL
ncbi:RICIN domain-containing protein [Streptomyces exfoliatus]|uniref:RICIN domain-containing protein n=1 Tax=Streptomyces exfoliatus TaxID=1905 RepID=UPI003C2EC577